MSVSSSHLERICASFPTLTLHSARHNPDGLANDVIVVNDELVFRFPKDTGARTALAREAKALELVRRYVETPVPHFERHEDDFVMYRRIPGEPLYRRTILSQNERAQERLAEELATFLRQLHAIPRDEAMRELGEPTPREPDYWHMR